jgi:putative resolvase
MSDKIRFYTVKEVCEVLKIKPLTVYRWLKAGKLKAVKIGKSYRVEQSEFEKFISKKSN